MMATYHATVTREGNLWVATVAEQIGQTVMDYEHLAELHEDLPSFIGDMTGADADAIQVEYRYVLSEQDVTEPFERFFATMRELRRIQAAAEHARLDALNLMSSAGMSQRAMADAVGLSHQRVQQLVRVG
jgi:hypothetical protein